MKNKKVIALLTAIVLIFSSFGAFAQQEEVTVYSNALIKNMIKTYGHIIADNNYYGVDDDELLYAVICSAIDEGKVDVDKALEAMIRALDDEHAEFYSPEEYAKTKEEVTGEVSGIGVVITQAKEGVLVLSVMQDSPAFRAGIMENDLIVGVDGTRVEGLSVLQIRSYVTGPLGTDVTVTIKRGDSEFDVKCTRDTVAPKQIETKMLNDKVAYMRLAQFTGTAPDDVEEYVKELQSKNIKNLVLDLRNNPGGDLQAAVKIANIFISAGKLGELRYRNEKNNTVIRSTNLKAPRFKVLVLVNGNSASASEFLAMAFQSRGAGKIMGTQTYGKGSMQALMEVATGAGMKYTVGEFFSYKGQKVDTVGITPDFVVENTITKPDWESFAPIDYAKVDTAIDEPGMILALEQRLEALGYMETADEEFDETTKAAVKRLQAMLGYDTTGIPAFYEYLFLNDYNYDFEIEVDDQLDAAIKYFQK